MSELPARYTDFEFPPYTYVPGAAPHPLSKEGHGCLGPHYEAVPHFEIDWRECAAYLWGIDLFNYGFYWESHEAWEGIWRDLNDNRVLDGMVGGDELVIGGPSARVRPDVSGANWCKGLIKLAAAAVKIREGRIIGVKRHAQRAAELLESVHAAFPQRFAGLDTKNLHYRAVRLGKDLDAATIAKFAPRTRPPLAVRVVPLVLELD